MRRRHSCHRNASGRTWRWRGGHSELRTCNTNIPGKSLIALVVDYAPGGASSSHSHARSAFIFGYVVSGAIETQVNDEPKRIVRAGESFYEPPGSRHPVSRNASATEPAKLLAVFVVDTKDRALTMPNK